MEFLIKLSGAMKYLMGFLKIKWGYSGVDENQWGLPLKSLGFTFNGAVTGCRRDVLSFILFLQFFAQMAKF